MKKAIFIFFIIFLFFSYINCYSDERFSYNNLLYKDIIGKIYIPGTNINNYVVRGSNHSYYLTHSYPGDLEVYGSIFLDARNKVDEKKLLIYGHNSKNSNKALFKDLEKFKDRNFFNNNKYIYLTLGNKKYKYLVFAINIVPNDSNYHTRINYNNFEFYRYVLNSYNSSLYDTDVSIDDVSNMITLQTCNYDSYNTYLLVNAKRIGEI